MTAGAPAAGVHLPWSGVPNRVRAWAEQLLGGAPLEITDLRGGFSPGATSLLRAPERTLFVKAVGHQLNPDSPGMHRREVRVSSRLPRQAPFPTLVDSYDDGDWVALAFEAIEGLPPRHPWDPDELRAAVDALLSMHQATTPPPVVKLEPSSVYFAPMFDGWRTLAAATEVQGLDEWSVAHLEQLAEVEAGWPEAASGSTLVHGDVRSDNLLLGAGGVRLVDWPHASVGAPIVDVVAWASSVRLEGGPEPEGLLAMHDEWASTDVAVLRPLVAAVSGFFISHSLRPSPPGLPTLRDFQAAQGEVALAWLRRLWEA